MQVRTFSFLGAGVLFGLSVAATADATVWVPVNNCWDDFDVGGGWFCGKRTSACAGDSTDVLCSLTIPIDPPQPYKNRPPAFKHIALDSAGFVYIVSTNNRIYNENPSGNDWQLFGTQPPVSCISKLVASGDLRNDPKLLVMGCDAQRTTYQYLQHGWGVAELNTVDVSVGSFDSNGEYFFSLNSLGERPLFTSSVGSRTWATLETGTTLHPTGTGMTPAAMSIVGGNIGFTADYFGTCGGAPFFLPTLFYQYWGGPYVLPYGNDPGGCSSGLQITGMFDPQGGPAITKMVHSGISPGRGPGSDILWIMTNQTRIYALTTDGKRQ